MGAAYVRENPTPKIAGYKVQETLHFRYLKFLVKFVSPPTLPETNIAPENGWLEYFFVSLGPGLFSEVFAVSFRECFFSMWVFPKIGVPPNHPF